ncbi:MAG: phospholipase D-like domain-containing protein [Candidatus Saccharibacteria bacterium]|nr:phospholipase D-like domain-containing protein [Candidatus Saccharibacteria bacterium]
MFKMIQSLTPSLYDQDTFDTHFLRDVKRACHSVIIESPFIRLSRIEQFLPIFKRLTRRGVKIIINTRHPDEHDTRYRTQAIIAIQLLQEIGVEILFTTKHHRKLAIIDREIIYEGSLNILSYYDSCEIMRRITSKVEAEMLIEFIKLNKFMEVK